MSLVQGCIASLLFLGLQVGGTSGTAPVTPVVVVNVLFLWAAADIGVLVARHVPRAASGGTRTMGTGGSFQRPLPLVSALCLLILAHNWRAVHRRNNRAGRHWLGTRAYRSSADQLARSPTPWPTARLWSRIRPGRLIPPGGPGCRLDRAAPILATRRLTWAPPGACRRSCTPTSSHGIADIPANGGRRRTHNRRVSATGRAVPCRLFRLAPGKHKFCNQNDLPAAAPRYIIFSTACNQRRHKSNPTGCHALIFTNK